MSLPIDRTAKSTLDANLVNGITSDAPAVKGSNDVVYNTVDELYNYTIGLIASGALSRIPYNDLYGQALINPGLEVCQRFGPLGSTVLTDGTAAYVVDHIRSMTVFSGANATASQVAVSDLDGATYGLKIVHATTPTNQGRLTHLYTIEARDAYKLAGQQVVIAVKVMAVGAMNQCTLFARYKTSESAIAYDSPLISQSAAVTISNTSWTTVLLVVTLPNRATLTSNGVFGFSITASKTTAELSGEGFIISEMEFIKADRDLGFQPRSIAAELALCQRYYWKSFNFAVAPAQNAGASGSIMYRVHVAGVTSDGTLIKYPTRMRTTPTLTFYNPSAPNANWRNFTTGIDSGAGVAQAAGDSGCFVDNSQVVGDAVGNIMLINMAADAEL